MKLIDKDALVAEIERRIKRFREEKDSVSIVKTNTYKGIFSFINTLEVKEVDLEKAIDDYIYTHDGRKRLALELDWKYCKLTLKDGNEIIKFAKHFFELGLSVSNKTQKDSNDAFIEKACKFLDGCIPDYIDLKHANVDMNVDNKKFIEDFKNYIKGE